MAKILKATIVMLSEAPRGQPGIAGKVVAKYIIGDDGDAAVNTVKFQEVATSDLGKPAAALFAEVVTAIKRAEGIV